MKDLLKCVAIDEARDRNHASQVRYWFDFLPRCLAVASSVRRVFPALTAGAEYDILRFGAIGEERRWIQQPRNAPSAPVLTTFSDTDERREPLKFRPRIFSLQRCTDLEIHTLVGPYKTQVP